jgi:hypothetical protein
MLCSFIIERYDYKRSCTIFAHFFQNWDFLQDFLQIPIISPEESAKTMGVAEGAQRSVFRVNDSEKGGCAARGRVANCCTIKTYIVSGTVEVEEIPQGVVEVPCKARNVRRNVRHLSKNRKNIKNRSLPIM